MSKGGRSSSKKSAAARRADEAATQRARRDTARLTLDDEIFDKVMRGIAGVPWDNKAREPAMPVKRRGRAS